MDQEKEKLDCLGVPREQEEKESDERTQVKKVK